MGVVHGDLNGANILVDDDGSARLCDFGLSSIAAEFQGTSYITSTIGGNARWAAPELFLVADDGSVARVNERTDAYSYGSVTLEVRIFFMAGNSSTYIDAFPRFFRARYHLCTFATMGLL